MNSNNNDQDNSNNIRSPILEYQNYQINVVVVGNRNTGKSELLNKYCEHSGLRRGKLNSEIKLKRIVKNDKYIRFRFYDVGEFYNQLNSYLGVIFVYDITNYQSFESIKEYYYQQHYLNSRKSNIFIINNKNSNDQDEEYYSNNISNNNSSSGDNRMDDLFYKVFKNVYLRNLIYSFKKRDIIIKYLIGTKLDLKNNPTLHNSNNNNNNNNSDTDEYEIQINYSKSTTKHQYNNNNNRNQNNNNNNNDNEASTSSVSSTNKYVTTEEAKEFANKMGARFHEVSSIENLHLINEIFNEFTDQLITNYEQYAQSTVLESLNSNTRTHYHQDDSRSTVINHDNILSPPSLSTVNRNRNNLSSVYWRRKCTLN